MNKLIRTIISLAFCCILSFTAPVLAVADNTKDKDETPNVIEQIHGFAVTRESEESTNAFLQHIRWEKVSTDSVKMGLIHGFAVIEEKNICAVLLNNLYLFREQVCEAAYSFYPSGSYTLFSDNGKLYLLFYRSNQLIQFDEKNNITLFTLQMEKINWSAYERLGIIGSQKTIQKGDYRITNRNPSIVPFISDMYDTLLWNDMVLYENALRLYWIIIGISIHAIALFFIIKWIFKMRFSRNKREYQK